MLHAESLKILAAEKEKRAVADRLGRSRISSAIENRQFGDGATRPVNCKHRRKIIHILIAEQKAKPSRLTEKDPA